MIVQRPCPPGVRSEAECHPAKRRRSSGGAARARTAPRPARPWPAGEGPGVPRTRVRPVLVRLAGEQVVTLTLTPRRGASIARPTVDEAREVFEARRLIEPRPTPC
ncbi:hypothetical protein SAMN04489709_10579 [Paracidovorax citrulli]|nr:hypothetical protein SAMN04489709_10579 [Paracidovorax citrulli]